MTRFEFKNQINPLAVLLNSILLAGSIKGIIDCVLANCELASYIPFVTLFTILVANEIRLVKPKIIIELDENRLIYRAFFGWKKCIKIEGFSKDNLLIKSRETGLELIRRNKILQFYQDGLKALFNLERNSNLYYKNRIIYKGIER